METMKIDGACHCGLITYEAVIDPRSVAICHCTDCQTLTGSAYRVSVPAMSDAFSLLSGRPKIYIKTAESGARRAQAFCPDCGTPIYASDVSDAQTYMIRLGTVRQRAVLAPHKQIWCRSALAWSADLRSLAAADRQE